MNTILTVPDIAATLKISKALAYRLVATGQIPSIRFGRTVRVHQEDLVTFIQRNSVNVEQCNPVGSRLAMKE